MAGELVGKQETSMIFSKYNDRLRECRRITHSWMGKQSVRETFPMQEAGAYKLMESLLESPEKFSDHVRT